MAKALLFLADGFEEVEALATVDVLRRGGVELTTAAVAAGCEVTGAHGIKVIADKNISEAAAIADEADAVICPGGMPGSENLKNSDKVINIVKDAFRKGKIVAAICAAPMVLEAAGVLKDKNFTMYPGMQNYAPSGKYHDNIFAVKDGNIITGAGPAAAFQFALTILEELTNGETAKNVASGMLIK